MSKFQLAEGLSLPLEIVTERSAFIGRTGQGKSYAAQKLAELLHTAGAQFIVLDPVGVWWGLRLAANGKDPGLEIPVLGGLHGDVPLEAGAGKLIADLAVDRGLSMVLDVSGFEHDTDRNRFAGDFAERFFHRKKSQPSAVLLMLEESQEFVPQNPGPKETGMLHAFTRLAKIGRNFGIGVSLITQRPQEVNKKVLNLTELLFAFQLNGTHERKAVETWIEDKAIDEDIGAELPKLKPWHPHAWSPSWLGVSKVVGIHRKWTFDASSTPKAGAAVGTFRALGPIDLEKLRTSMAATIEKAKAEDPKELRRQLAEVKRELAKKEAVLAEVDVRTKRIDAKLERVQEKRVEVPVLKEGHLARLEKALAAFPDRLSAAIAPMADVYDRTLKAVDPVVLAVGHVAEILSKLNGNGHKPPVLLQRPVAATAPGSRNVPVRSAPRPAPAKTPTRAATWDGEQITGPEQRILDAIAWLEDIGVETPEQSAVAFVAGYTIGGGAFNNPRGRLNQRGLVTYRPGDRIELTEPGRALAQKSDTALTVEELQRRVLERLPGPEQRILRPLLEAYPEAMTMADLAAAAGYGEGGGAFNNPRGRLRTLGLIEYPSPGQAVARPLLFLENR